MRRTVTTLRLAGLCPPSRRAALAQPPPPPIGHAPPPHSVPRPCCAEPNTDAQGFWRLVTANLYYTPASSEVGFRQQTAEARRAGHFKEATPCIVHPIVACFSHHTVHRAEEIGAFRPTTRENIHTIHCSALTRHCMLYTLLVPDGRRHPHKSADTPHSGKIRNCQAGKRAVQCKASVPYCSQFASSRQRCTSTCALDPWPSNINPTLTPWQDAVAADTRGITTVLTLCNRLDARAEAGRRGSKAHFSWPWCCADTQLGICWESWESRGTEAL